MAKSSISPLADFILMPKERGGLGVQNRMALARGMYDQNPRRLGRQTLAANISNYFKYSLPLSQPFKDYLYAIAGRKLHDALQEAIRQHETEFERRRDPIETIRAHYEQAEQVVFLGLEPISANLTTVPESLLNLLSYSFGQMMAGPLVATMGIPNREMAQAIWTGISNRIKEWFPSLTSTGWRSILKSGGGLGLAWVLAGNPLKAMAATSLPMPSQSAPLPSNLPAST